MGVLKHLSKGRDVLLPHSLTAAHLHGLANPLVHLPCSWALSCYIIGQLGQWTIGKSSKDLWTNKEYNKRSKVIEIQSEKY